LQNALPKEYSKKKRINKYALSLHANMTPRAGLDKNKTKAGFTVKSSKGSHQFIEKGRLVKKQLDKGKRVEIRTKSGGCTEDKEKKKRSNSSIR